MIHLRNPLRVNDHWNRSSQMLIWVILEPKITVPLRETGRIAVNFTSRIFPTPMRESQAEVEEQVRLNTVINFASKR